MDTMNDIFFSVAGKYPERPAVIDGDKRVSYGELGRMALSFASFLSSRGVGKGDRAAVFLPNSLELITAYFGIFSLGAVSVPINSLFKEEEIAFYLEDSGVRVLLTDSGLRTPAERAASQSGALVYTIRGPHADWVYAGDSPEVRTDAPVTGGEDAIYLYSTGSTGKPKRVARTHSNLTALAQNHSYTAGFTEEDRVLFTVPLSHTYAFGNFISAVNAGSAAVVLDEFNRQRVIDILEKELITIFPAVPVMLDALAGTFLPEGRDLSSLRLVISAGAPLREETFRRFFDRFSVYPRQLYGSTETGVISINLAEDIERRPSSVGRPVKNVTVRVLGDDGRVCGTDEEGEITVRSPSMTRGYDGLPEETEKVFRDGFYFTGDLGRIDSEGYIYITGRRKFFINAGGYKVDPAEVENLLVRIPGITDAVVLGVRDKNGKEHVKAVLVADRQMNAADVVGFCRGKIADYKIPLSIEFKDELPRSPSGKVLRERLK